MNEVMMQKIYRRESSSNKIQKNNAKRIIAHYSYCNSLSYRNIFWTIRCQNLSQIPAKKFQLSVHKAFKKPKNKSNTRIFANITLYERKIAPYNVLSNVMLMNNTQLYLEEEKKLKECKIPFFKTFKFKSCFVSFNFAQNVTHFYLLD